MAYRKIDASVEEEMLALRKSGMLDKDIADVVGVSVDTVRNHIGRNPLEPNRPGAKQKVSDDELITLANKGMKMTEIAKTLGISYQTVRARFKKLRTNHMVKPLMEPPAKEPEKPAFDPAFDVEHTKRVTPTPVKPTPVKPAPAKPQNVATIETELLDFAYVPAIYEQLYKLSLLAVPEPWRFKNPKANPAANLETPILESYIRETFKRRAMEYNSCPVEELDKIFYIRDKFCCFHTGLYDTNYQGIYATFIPNRNPAGRTRWFFQGFDTHNSPELRVMQTLPEHRRPMHSKPFDLSLDTLINYNHILDNNVERLPDMVRNYWNGGLLLETALELAKRKARTDSSEIVSANRVDKAQYLLPIYISNPDTPDIAAVLVDMGGYYHLQTCLTPEMAYRAARAVERPKADWLRALVE